MSLFTIADLHLPLSKDKPMDIFKGWDNYVKNIISTKNSDELFFYLDHLTVIEISLISSFGIDVAFMNLLKVSE